MKYCLPALAGCLRSFWGSWSTFFRFAPSDNEWTKDERENWPEVTKSCGGSLVFQNGGGILNEVSSSSCLAAGG